MKGFWVAIGKPMAEMAIVKIHGMMNSDSLRLQTRARQLKRSDLAYYIFTNI